MRSEADTLSRFVFEGAAVRGARVHLEHTSRAMLGSHDYPPALARVLAELSGAALLLAAALKFDGSLILQLVGSGPVRLIVVECNPGLALRGTAQWNADARIPDDATLFTLAGREDARLTITLDPREAGPMYQGIVSLEAASVATMIEHYLATSEQLASKLALDVVDGEVVGLLLQRMPASGQEDDATWQRVTAALTKATRDELSAAATSDAGLAALFSTDDVRVFKPSEPRYRCTCSRSRVEGALRIAGRGEIEAALAQDGEVDVTCEFCGMHYTFTPSEARTVFALPASGASMPH
ncbi:MAG TPA: Hsp33 family molecular chaperone HslO [Casimicrobiaceae bacterium]|nr:Hsp33 family molecular chaperone HslO [Casimicrobiaceae bacterium]